MYKLNFFLKISIDLIPYHLFLIYFIPLLLLVLLIGLELGVAVIQSFVFSILSCMYINDAINLH